jgi:hypothetical protein
LFILYIYNLPDEVLNDMYLFANVTKIFSGITSKQDTQDEQIYPDFSIGQTHGCYHFTWINAGY